MKDIPNQQARALRRATLIALDMESGADNWPVAETLERIEDAEMPDRWDGRDINQQEDWR